MSIEKLVMTNHLYETLTELLDLAIVGAEAQEREADGPADRLRVAEAAATIERAKFYVNEYAERFAAGDLSD